MRKIMRKIILNATLRGGGGQDVLNTMRTQFTKLGSFVIPREILTNYSKVIDNKSLNKTLKQLIKFS